MRVIPASLPGVLIIEPQVFSDHRGFFLETYHEARYREAGIADQFVQDNHSRSVKGTLRGLHAQLHHPQAKLVRAIRGEIFDVAVDIRPDSPSFANWVGVTLSAENFRQCYIPAGFAHGFYVMSESAEVAYKSSTFYDPTDEVAIAWDDRQIRVEWPSRTPSVSDKDRAARSLADIVRLIECRRP